VNRLLTPANVIEITGLHKDTVYSEIRSGRLKAVRLGRTGKVIRIKEEDLQSYIDADKSARRVEGAPAPKTATAAAVKPVHHRRSRHHGR